MKNWKTTLSGLLAGLPLLLNQIAPVLPPKYAAIATGVGLVLTGYFAVDGKGDDKT